MTDAPPAISTNLDQPLDADDADEASVFRYHITAYGADYPVDALVKRVESGDIVVPTFDPQTTYDPIEGFQRHFVWSKRQSDRFVESLLLGFPVPGIFLVTQPDGRLLVLDGQQRLRTLQCFYDGTIKGRQFTLTEVQEQFIGKTYKSLDADDRRRLDNSIIHATVVRQDEPSDDQSSVYMVFERLNTGGTALQPQEIRVALYSGPFINFLRDLNELTDWREIYGPKSKRLKDQELILRFFALLYAAERYQPPMKDFLNGFAAANRYFDLHSQDAMKYIFTTTVQNVLAALGSRAFRLKSSINVAVMDSVMVAIANRIISKGEISDIGGIKTQYEELISSEEFRSSVESGTTHESNVKLRLNAARQSMDLLD